MNKFNKLYTSNILQYVYKEEIAQRAKYTSNTGTANLTVANTNLDGTGTIYHVVTSAVANGTLIKSITIKAATTFSKGIVRIFLDDNATTPILVSEIEIPERSQGSIQESFSISLEVNYFLKNGWALAASTQLAQSTIVTAEGLDISFP